MNGRYTRFAWVGLAAGVAGWSCADWDNPTALSEIEPDVEFEVEAVRVETLEELEWHVHVREGGSPMDLEESQMEIESPSGTSRVVDMLPEGEGYAAHVTFYEPGEHHLHLMGMPHGHRLMAELGEHEVEVHRRHTVIGPYWVEIESSPAPVPEGSTAHIHLHVFDLGQDGLPGAAVTGLEIEVEVHGPAGDEAHLPAMEEEPGEYEVEHAFGPAGVYELHVGIEVGAEHEEGEFHLPVIAPDEDGAEDGQDEEEDGHDHAH